VENLPKFRNRGALRLDSASESDSVELELRSSSARVGDRRKDVVGGCSRLVMDGRRTKFSQRCSLPSMGVSLREESREWRTWLTVVVDVELLRRPPGAINTVSLVVKTGLIGDTYSVEEFPSGRRLVWKGLAILQTFDELYSQSH
jgi:hypothetical protein